MPATLDIIGTNREAIEARGGDAAFIHALAAEAFDNPMGGLANCANAYLEAGDVEAARLCWHAVRKHYPESPLGFRGEAMCLQNAARTAEADAILEVAMATFPLDPLVAKQYAFLAMASGDVETGQRRLSDFYVRLKEFIDTARRVGNTQALGQLLAIAVEQFNFEPALAVEYAAAAPDTDEMSRRWLMVGQPAVEPDYFRVAWQIVHAHILAGRQDTPDALYAALLSEPLDDCDRYAPYFLIKLFMPESAPADLIAELRARLQRHLAGAQASALTPAAELAVLRLNLEIAGVNRLSLLVRHMTGANQDKQTMLFSAPDLMAVIPALGEMMIAAGTFAKADPTLLYNLGMLLKCSDQFVHERFLSIALDTLPDIRDLRHPVGMLLLAARSRASRPHIARRTAPLRIAVCISGQLRDYRRAFPSWAALGLDQHHTEYFIHTWTSVGRKPPVPAHARRVFAEHFAAAYQQAFKLCRGDFFANYPSLLRFFQGVSDTLTPEEVRSFYNATQVFLEDDPEPFGSAPVKMYRKVQGAWQLMGPAAATFDLVIRARADLQMVPSREIDWHAIHQACVNDRMIYTGGGAIGLRWPGTVVGDLFAIGDCDTMAHYSHAFDQAHVAAAEGHFGAPRCIAGHLNFAYEAIKHGIRIRSVVEAGFDATISDYILRGAELEATLRADMGSAGPRDEIDAMLLAACAADDP